MEDKGPPSFFLFLPSMVRERKISHCMSQSLVDDTHIHASKRFAPK